MNNFSTVEPRRTASKAPHAPSKHIYDFAKSEVAKGVEAYDRLVRERPLKPPTRMTQVRK